jgi:choice-of-anchor C domain-containing protein
VKTKLLSIAASLAIFGAISPASANLIVNGSFEIGVDPGGSFKTIFGGDNTSITGWTVGGDSVDYISGYWQPGDGARSLDLSGNALGSVSQSFAVTDGQLYTVSFLLAGNPDKGPTIKEVGVTTNSSSQDFFFNITGFDKGNMGWTPESFTFKASGSLETLTFASLACADVSPPCAFGPALDAVNVTSAVPELSTWGMMLIGFAGVGMIAYCRARKVSPVAIV